MQSEQETNQNPNTNQTALSEFKAKLLPEDFSDEFRKIVHDYKCPLCKGVYYNPYVDKCGHVFCRECITTYLQAYHQCPFSKQQITTENLNKLVFMTEILEKQSVKCKNRSFGCDWIGRLSELETHMDYSCKRQIIACPNFGCCEKIFREEKESHVALCDYRIVCCEFCLIFIPFIEIKKHYEVCPKFIMDCLQQCGKKVERKEMEKHIEELCLNTVISCPFAGVGCEHVGAKKDLKKHFEKDNAEHMLFMFACLVKSQRSVNAAKDNIARALDCFQQKLASVDYASKSDTSGFAAAQVILVEDLKQCLLPLQLEQPKDYCAEIFSFLKVGFIFNNKQKEQTELKGCYAAQVECKSEQDALSSSSHVKEPNEFANAMLEKVYFAEDGQALRENEQKVSNAFIDNVNAYNKESVGKLSVNCVSLLGNIPGSNPSMILELNEINFSAATESHEKECCSKTKLLGFKRRKVSEGDKANDEDQKIQALEINVNDNNIQVNELKNNSLMDINN